ncbi:hypothetical protein O4H62_10375 [Hoeflea alexandrii]|nr:hypothetical protein [Hoeflea alexandrii]
MRFEQNLESAASKLEPVYDIITMQDDGQNLANLGMVISPLDPQGAEAASFRQPQVARE